MGSSHAHTKTLGNTMHASVENYPAPNSHLPGCVYNPQGSGHTCRLDTKFPSTVVKFYFSQSAKGHVWVSAAHWDNLPKQRQTPEGIIAPVCAKPKDYTVCTYPCRLRLLLRKDTLRPLRSLYLIFLSLLHPGRINPLLFCHLSTLSIQSF